MKRESGVTVRSAAGRTSQRASTAQALERALATRHDAEFTKLLHHSDRGCQYASEAFRHRLGLCGITQFMSRQGHCYDNAAMESFWATLKAEGFGTHPPPPAPKPASRSSITSRRSTTPCASTAH